MKGQLFFIGLFLLTLTMLPDWAHGQNTYSHYDAEATVGYASLVNVPSSPTGYATRNKGKGKVPLIIKLEIADTFRVNVRKSLMLAYGQDQMLQKDAMNLYELSEELMVGGEWIESHDHFAIWDSKKVNPYNFNPVKFEESVAITLKDGENPWLSPMKDTTKINSVFGMRRYRWHHGVDLDLSRGDTVRAVADGIVRVAQYDRYGYGHYVVLRHKNGLETLYGHFLKRIVRVGQEVKRGDVIGLGGSTGRSTGYHLHFEVRYKGVAIDPIQLYDFEKNGLKADKLQVTPQTFAYVKELRKKRYHRIRSGDTLGRISRRYRTTIGTICRLNGISSKKILRIGRVLRVR